MENSNSKFSIEALRQLMAESPAYTSLPDAQKQLIEGHITANNKPVLLYIFQQLREEADARALSRQKLAKKILKIDPIDLSSLRDL
ncbi:hypothetical protein IT411_00880 [Candidatus Peregrinibacteria bacterium]|nr:hypothetical protein [Candidatus Peregrinibacteria bacterium]